MSSGDGITHSVVCMSKNASGGFGQLEQQGIACAVCVGVARMVLTSA